MKTIIQLSTVIGLMLVTFFSVFSQKAFYFGPETTINVTDSVVIRLNDYQGDIHWQKSLDMENWVNIQTATCDTLLFVADTTTYFRAQVIAGDCDPFYSDTTHVGVFRVITSQVTDITSVSAVSGGSVISDGGANVTVRGVVWSTFPNPSLDSNNGYTTDGSGMGEFISNMANLIPETPYYIKAYATNNVGTGYGQQENFTTNYNSGGTIQPGSGVTDIDDNFYPSVIIGNQEWMAENLRVTHNANGNYIARYCYNNNADICELYGGLYTWQTAMNDAGSSNTNPSYVQGICPTGWHLPSASEWTELVDYVVSQGHPNIEILKGAGNALKSCRQVSSPLGGDCATTEHPRWAYNSNHYGTDEFGFSALPGGDLETNGNFDWIYEAAGWWSSTGSLSDLAWCYFLRWDSSIVKPYNTNNERGFSIRCVKNN